MKTKKQIFFKTVRHDGSSVWAPPGLGRVYEIGKTYRFRRNLPAHVFKPDPYSNLDGQWWVRAEGSGGNRVLICWGIARSQIVPVVKIENFMLNTPEYNTSFRQIMTSTHFAVIGEIFMPPSTYRSSLELARPCPRVSDRVLQWLRSQPVH